MQQPELGRRLTALRKAKNFTQEDLVEKSHVSVRTIQRIEAGEVLPRTVTLKILLEALGESYDSFSPKQTQAMETNKNTLPTTDRNTLLIAALAGAVYLISEIFLGMMDMAWLIDDRDWSFRMNAMYTSLTVVMVLSFATFIRGFIALASLFENALLKVSAYLLIVVMVGKAVLDVSTLTTKDIELIWIPYAAIAMVIGVVSIIFGISLIRLQDGMGEMSRIAGLLEILMGCLLITVVLFFLAYVVLIPAVVLEILVLYRGYEYLSQLESAKFQSAEQ